MHCAWANLTIKIVNLYFRDYFYVMIIFDVEVIYEHFKLIIADYRGKIY